MRQEVMPRLSNSVLNTKSPTRGEANVQIKGVVNSVDRKFGDIKSCECRAQAVSCHFN